MNKKLLVKSFDLKSSKIYGGRVDITFRQCESATTYQSCTDVSTTTTDDNGATSTCTSYTCE